MRPLMCLILLCAFSNASCTGLKRDDVQFVAKWRGKHKGSSKIGLCTATLIAPQWAITARHCAVKLLGKKPSGVSVSLSFHRGKKILTAGVAKAIGAPLKQKGQKLDMALVKLRKSIRSIQPAVLDAKKYNQRMRTNVIPVGTSGGLHWTKAKVARGGAGGKLTVDNTDGSGMKGGDSGGAWLSTNTEGSYVLSGVIHGGIRKGKKRIGIAYQPSYVRSWIDQLTNGTATWTSQSPPASQKFAEIASVTGPEKKSTTFLVWGCMFCMALFSLVTFVRFRRPFAGDAAKYTPFSSEEHSDGWESGDAATVESAAP